MPRLFDLNAAFNLFVDCRNLYDSGTIIKWGDPRDLTDEEQHEADVIYDDPVLASEMLQLFFKLLPDPVIPYE